MKHIPSEMNRAQPIGVFDSGIGGLTVMEQIRAVVPIEHMIYFGDTARLPYGNKSPETIIRYSIENAIFLLEKQIKMLVVACNTASAFAIDRLRQIFKIPIIGVIEPGAEKAVSTTKTGNIAILGTKGTIQSGAYQKEILRHLPQATLFPLACPLFVPLVEEGFLSHPASRLIVKEYLGPLKGQNIDTLLLGCTHYPLLKTLIQEEMGDSITLIDSALTCAEAVAHTLKQYNLHSQSQTAQLEYYVSDDPQKFCELSRTIFHFPIMHVKKSHE